ncbi:soluble lytic murein transglycosylase [Cognatiyoonia koreensis]|uniref:Soluble lytic murein transglycosylase n=1 Tax=Cognatiyoonia koreensis TaxID=364200 RepID=A0A1I0RD24_9RHOB|nr:lytic transglycosylase domain-containing protein [Cognatiyoonia koreensis]SEW38697.1 soluble lytic murein transglycosylase [Cognatiyoonia koreensis]
MLTRLASLALCLTLGGAAIADVSSPSAVAAVAATDDQSWDTAYALATDDVTRDVVTWLRLREANQPFDDYRTFLASRSDWPGLDRIYERSEQAIPKGADPEAVIGWFKNSAPRTGEGAVRLAEALTATGEISKAKTVIEQAWVDLRLNERSEALILDTFGDVVEPFHPARTDALLWRWRTDEAARMLERLDDDQKALTIARVGYIRNQNNLPQKLAAVPEDLKNHPGLAYDRYNWLSERGRRGQAVALLLERSDSAEALGEPFRWSGWRRVLARWEMREGRALQAYKIASQHFLNDGSAYADLEWLSGYIALTYLDDPQLALRHFENGAAAVDSPISASRMAYWEGRALDMLGGDSRAAYTIAAQHQTAFYGLLAAEKLGLSLDPAITGQDDPTDWEEAAFLEDDLVQAALMLLEAGERGHAVTFFVALGRSLPEDDLARLGALLGELEEPYYQVVIGKSAVTQGRVVPSVYFPIHPLAELDLPVDAALSLSVGRRESEFNAGVGSPVGALGLMQLMPATAEEVAGFLDLPYSRARLTADWEYNAQLGAKYLAMLEEEFGPSPVMIAAGYNAGPSRPKIWMDERGDPREGTVDVIDWIEHIPFRETRNYVMRVTESIPVYEARLTGIANPIRFTELLIGEKPLIRPRGRPEVSAISTSDAPPTRAVARPEAPAAISGPRPLARPTGN